MGDTSANPLYVVCSDWDLPIRSYEAYFVRNEGIEEIDNNIIVTTDRHQVTIEGAQGRHIEIFDAVGRCIVQTTATSNNSTFVIPHAGFYIVRIEKQRPRKIIIH